MYQKTQDSGDYLKRVASHATKGSPRGTVWWAKDQFDPFQERTRLTKKKRVLRKQLAVLQEAMGPLPHGVMRKYNKEMQQLTAEKRRLRAEYGKVPPHPRKLITDAELLTDRCPEGMNIHKFRRLKRRMGRHS